MILTVIPADISRFNHHDLILPHRYLEEDKELEKERISRGNSKGDWVWECVCVVGGGGGGE